MADPLTSTVTGAASDIFKLLFALVGILIIIAIIKWLQSLKGRGTEIRVYRAPE